MPVRVCGGIPEGISDKARIYPPELNFLFVKNIVLLPEERIWFLSYANPPKSRILEFNESAK